MLVRSSRLNGPTYLRYLQSFLAEPFRSRRAVLHERFPPYFPERDTANGTSPTGHARHGPNSVGLPARLNHVRSVASADGREAVECFWQEAVESRSEGLMIKVKQDIYAHRITSLIALAPAHATAA
jgi:ATP-dependent DNA ligase